MNDDDKLLRIAGIVNAFHNGDDGELTPCQAAKMALRAIADVLGDPMVPSETKRLETRR